MGVGLYTIPIHAHGIPCRLDSLLSHLDSFGRWAFVVPMLSYVSCRLFPFPSVMFACFALCLKQLVIRSLFPTSPSCDSYTHSRSAFTFASRLIHAFISFISFSFSHPFVLLSSFVMRHRLAPRSVHHPPFNQSHLISC